MYLVIGATGRTGSAVLRTLLNEGKITRVLLRDETKRSTLPTSDQLNVVVGDLRNPNVLAKAMNGIEVVYLSMANFPEQEQSELAVVQAAHEAGVRKIVKLSAPTAGPKSPVAIARMHGRIEKAIKSKGLEYVFLRPYAFFQNLLNQMPTLARLNTLFASTGLAPLNMVDARDVGAVAAQTMLDETYRANVIELTGSQALAYDQVAKRLQDISGDDYRYIDQTAKELHGDLVQQGLTPWIAEHVIEIQALTVSKPESPNTNVKNILGRDPLTIESYLPELLEEIAKARNS